MISVKFRGTSNNHIYLDEQTLGLWIHALDHAIMTCKGKYEEPFLEEIQEYIVELYDIVNGAERKEE